VITTTTSEDRSLHRGIIERCLQDIQLMYQEDEFKNHRAYVSRVGRELAGALGSDYTIVELPTTDNDDVFFDVQWQSGSMRLNLTPPSQAFTTSITIDLKELMGDKYNDDMAQQLNNLFSGAVKQRAVR